MSWRRPSVSSAQKKKKEKNLIILYNRDLTDLCMDERQYNALDEA